jgi:hypothetical protein
MRHLAETKCFGKGLGSKLTCKEMLAESLHKQGGPHCGEEEAKDGFVNMTEGEYECGGNEGWRTPNDSWLDMEEQDNTAMYNVHVVVNEDEGNVDEGDDKHDNGQAERSSKTSFENVQYVAAVLEDRRRKKRAM